MNKTAILSYILDEVALKCRNVSSNMRKRIHWMLKEKEITVEEYDKRILILNGSIRVGKGAAEILKVKQPKKEVCNYKLMNEQTVKKQDEKAFIFNRSFGARRNPVETPKEEINKGISNYQLKNQEQLDKVKAINTELRCHSISFNLTDAIQIQKIEYLSINPENYDIYSKSFFTQSNNLSLERLSTDQIKFILSRFERIDSLKIRKSSLKSIDFKQKRIKSFCFELVSLYESVWLPSQIDKLELFSCRSANLIKAQRVNRICIDDEDSDPKYRELLETLRGIKTITVHNPMQEPLTRLPSGAREVNVSELWSKSLESEKISENFPYLIEIKGMFPIQKIKETNLRAIEPIISQTEEKFKLRPRKIVISSENAVRLNNHPELFEKVEQVKVFTDEFNFDVLPSEIKKIEIVLALNKESLALNRL